MKARDIEAEVALWLNPFVNTVVPNVTSFWWAHESDLIMLTPRGYGYEVEIKVSRADLVADKKKQRWRASYAENPLFPVPSLIKAIHFAGPETIEEDLLELAPPFAGILVVREKTIGRQVQEVRKPNRNPQHRKWTDEETLKFTRLAYVRFVSERWIKNRR